MSCPSMPTWRRQSDTATADAYTLRIMEACFRLADFPGRGTPQDEPKPGLRSIAFERRATIYYEVRSPTVEIAQILHGGRDQARAFSSD